MHPDNSKRLNTFVFIFLTYCEFISEIISSSFRGCLFFATLFVLDFGWLFAFLETFTVINAVDTWIDILALFWITSISRGKSLQISQLGRDLNATFATSAAI
ncbi:hypothetical protein LX32DRAFT_681292 [Colletotrichum zoysiae]|uniref:Uncharacterized protein n=1 Tax=Colletotrichum zoysiae TaxID=1216348 RepID=A0AAD9HL81_9PEZI|nr:hypothetical protein LX32DRAFT_681292 [Colletotrichum zoysiae]